MTEILWYNGFKIVFRKVVDDIKVFDFDNTLYHGESSIDLAFYMIRRNRKILLYVPSIVYNLAKYKMCLIDRDKAEKEINDFLKVAVKDKYEAAELVESFWAENIHRLDLNIIKRVNKDDVIITAGPDMLINAIKDKLGTENILSSVIDPDKREMTYFNFGENKAKRYKEVYGDTPIDSLYTDSFNDKPLMKLANKVFIVEKGRLKKMTEQGKAKLLQ